MRDHVNEHDEFLLSQLLDGDLSEPQAAALRVRLEQESGLREAFEELCRLDRLVRAQRLNQPNVDYDRFHQVVMQRVAAGVSQVSEQDEYLLSQLIDGSLVHEEKSDLLQRLEAEPALRSSYESLVRVDAALTACGTEMPAVDYGRFHSQVMKQVRAEAGAARTIRFPMWARVVGPIAAAAAIALVVWMQPGLRVDMPSPGPAGEWVQSDLPGSSSGEVSDGALVAERVVPEPVVVVMMNAAAPRSDGGAIKIEFGKPADRDTQVEAIQVSFGRSSDIAEAVQRVDDERARQPIRKIFVAAANPVNQVQTGLEAELF